MKKFLIVAAAVAALSAVPASAQSSNTLTYDLNAQVASVCGVFNFTGTNVTVNFGALAATPAATLVAQAAGSATYRCNAVAGFTRTISSLNNGFLTLDRVATTDANRRIPFSMSHGGGNGLGFAFQQLIAPVVGSFGGSTAFLAGQTGGVNFQTNGVQAAAGGNGAPGTTVFAGNYQDVVTISVTAN